jgi:ceramide glucosyltransferase
MRGVLDIQALCPARSGPARLVQRNIRVALVALFVLTGIVATHVWLASALRARKAAPPPPSRWPSLTVVRPIRGLDIGADENFAATLDNDYLGPLETIFVFDDEHDPALPVVRRVIDAHRQSGGRGLAKVLIAGPPPPSMTGKLHAMSYGMQHARGELIAFGDSDTRPRRELLSEMVAALLAQPDAGDVFVPVAVRTPARTAGDAAYALLIDAWYGPAASVAAARSGGHLPFIMGQLMIFRRSALRSVGGIECAEGQLTDDMYIGRRVAEAGWLNVVVEGARLDIATGGMTIDEFVRLMRRWLAFSRNGLPARFTAPHWARCVEFWAALVVGFWALHRGAWFASLVSLVAIGAACVSQVHLQRVFGGPRLSLRHAWVPFGLLLSAPLAGWAVLSDRSVRWRGRAYALAGNASLAEDKQDKMDTWPELRSRF